jgi:hypothetical protein
MKTIDMQKQFGILWPIDDEDRRVLTVLLGKEQFVLFAQRMATTGFPTKLKR